MTCETCNQQKEDQTYTDVCNACVRLAMSEIWKELKPRVQDYMNRANSSLGETNEKDDKAH